MGSLCGKFRAVSAYRSCERELLLKTPQTVTAQLVVSQPSVTSGWPTDWLHCGANSNVMEQQRNSPLYSNYEDLRASELPTGSSAHMVNIAPGQQPPEPEVVHTKRNPVPEYRGFKTCKRQVVLAIGKLFVKSKQD